MSTLRALATGIVRDSRHADPTDLALELINSIDPEEFDTAVQIMARVYMRVIIGEVRAAANGGQPAQGSRKVNAARDAWQKLLSIPEYVPSSDAWIHLRDATREQVLEMAAHRMQKAHENAAAARRYERIATHMQSLNVKVVSDLPMDVLRNSIAPESEAA